MKFGLALLSALLLSLPALAQQVPNPMANNAANSDQPEALQNLTNQILSISGGILQAGSGSETPIYGTSTPTVLDIVKGTDAAPITTAGQQIRILYRQAITKDKCYDNAANTGCNSPLLINAIGSAATSMVTSGATFYAESSSPTPGSDAQPINSIAMVKGNAVGVAMGAFLIGYLKTTTGTGYAQGAEINMANDTGLNVCVVNTMLLGKCDGIWLAARASFPNTPLDSALHVGSADVFSGGFGRWKQAITVNSNAIFDTPNTDTKTLGDYSTSETSLYISGSHKYALVTDAAAGLVGLGTLVPTARLEIGGNLARSSWAGLGVAFRSAAATYTDTTSSGAVGYSTAVNAFLIPTIAATNATTYTSMATVYIQGCPIAGTNVTSPSCNALIVGGPSYFSDRVDVVGNIVAATLDTAGTIAGSICRTAAGLFIYKAGANCF